MRTRPELILLQKTMVVVEGVARGFDPKLDMWSVADPVVREWIERNLGPSAQFDDITRDGLVLSPETVAAIGKAEARRNRWTAAALWTIAGLLAWMVWLLV
jgi:ubiquinone biosynthesis protein